MDSLPLSERFYAGEFRHSLDEKNRVTIPSRWRRDQAEEFILLPQANHQFLLVISPEDFARMSAAVESNEGVSARDRRVVVVGEIDHARVLPEELCRKVGLKGEVALVGGRGRFEIWNLQRWKRAHEEETPTYEHVANVIGL